MIVYVRVCARARTAVLRAAVLSGVWGGVLMYVHMHMCHPPQMKCSHLCVMLCGGLQWL